MKIMITGATGYIGNRLANTLAERGYTVHALVRSEPTGNILNHPRIVKYHGDIFNLPALEIAMRGCSVVFHTAGLVRLWSRDPNDFFLNNVTGTKNILEAAIRADVRKVVYTSSCGVWGPSPYTFSENDPRVSAFDNDYDLSKYLAEKLVIEYGRKGLFTVIVNPPRVFGPGLERKSSGVNRYIKWLLSKSVCIIPWKLDVKANYAFINDVVDGHIMAMEKGLGGEKYILGGENVSYRELICQVRKHSQRKNILLRIPLPVLKIWAWIEVLRGKLGTHDPALTPGMASRFHLDKTFDCTKAIKHLGYTITPFHQALAMTINHLKN